MTFKIDACIAFAKLMLSNCLEDGPLLEHRIDFDFLVPGYCCGFSGTWRMDKSKGDVELVKNRFSVSALFEATGNLHSLGSQSCYE